MTTTNKLLDVSHIKLNQDLTSQQEVFEQIGRIAEEKSIVSSAKDVVAGLKKREAESTTGFQDGFAIPHTQIELVLAPGIIILSNKQGIEWESMDGKPARFFISLLIPRGEADSTHIRALASLSRMLIYEENRQFLIHADKEDAILAKVSEALNQ